MKQPSLNLTVLSVVVAGVALAACGKRDDVGAMKGSDETAPVTSTSGTGSTSSSSSTTVGEDMKKAGEDAKQATKDAATDVKDATKSAADQASNKVSDALITTSVKAELAKDSKLSALAINVDTDNGRVVLKGTAPDADSKSRATSLATAVKGVTSVDNQLTVGSKS
ncbi:BON domain-containing protein [Piscinibacter terrae]|nr:BON domain-containing protein [Albitalea terrae]